MPRRVACRRCGKPNPSGLCASCRSETYGSSEYAKNSALIRHNIRRAMSEGRIVLCIICGLPIKGFRDVTIEHIASVTRGGSNALSNLGPAHSACNYAKRPVV